MFVVDAMNTDLAERVVRQLADSIADILPTLEPEQIAPETRAALTRLIYAIGKFAEHPPGSGQKLEDGHPRLTATALDGDHPLNKSEAVQ